MNFNIKKRAEKTLIYYQNFSQLAKIERLLATNSREIFSFPLELIEMIWNWGEKRSKIRHIKKHVKSFRITFITLDLCVRKSKVFLWNERDRRSEKRFNYRTFTILTQNSGNNSNTFLTFLLRISMRTASSWSRDKIIIHRELQTAVNQLCPVFPAGKVWFRPRKISDLLFINCWSTGIINCTSTK